MIFPYLKESLNGFDFTFFAYGQTDSGKTYTMLGDNLYNGVKYYTMKEIFRIINSD